MLITIPKVSVKPTYFVSYVSYDSTNSKTHHDDDPRILPEENKHHGIISKKANKRVRLAIDWLLEVAKDKTLTKKGVATNFKFKVNFITLTLSSRQIHSDHEIKKTLLNQFLTELRAKYKCSHFLWRAETQRNGNIHFHVASDVFIPWRTLRTDWNRIQNKLGYVDRFTEKTGLTDPNSTDIHSVNKVRNLSMYLAKYCGKNAKGYVVMVSKASPLPFCGCLSFNYDYAPPARGAHFFRQVHGRLWGLSQALSKLKSAIHEVSDNIRAELDWLAKALPGKVKFLDKVTLYMFNAKDLLKVGCNRLGNMLSNYLKTIDDPKPDRLPYIPIPVYSHRSIKPKLVQCELF